MVAPDLIRTLEPVMAVAVRAIVPAKLGAPRRIDPAATQSLRSAAVRLITTAFAPGSAWRALQPCLVGALVHLHVDVEAGGGSATVVASGGVAEAVCGALGGVLVAAAAGHSTGQTGRDGDVGVNAVGAGTSTTSGAGAGAGTGAGNPVSGRKMDDSMLHRLMFATPAQCAAAVRLLFGGAAMAAVSSTMRLGDGDSSSIGEELVLTEAHLALIGAAAAYVHRRGIPGLRCDLAAHNTLLDAAAALIRRNQPVIASPAATGTGDAGTGTSCVASENATMMTFGETEYVTIGTTAQLGVVGQSYTVEAWIRPHGYTDEDNTIVGSDVCRERQTLHCILRNGRPRHGHYHHDEIATEVLELHRWYHLAFVYDVDAQSMTTFMNGEAISVSASKKACLIGEVPLNLSRWNGTSYGYAVAGVAHLLVSRH